MGIRTLEAQTDEKNKNIEARQNVTGSYKKIVYLERLSCLGKVINNVRIFGYILKEQPTFKNEIEIQFVNYATLSILF